jgi:acyl-CoA carboxylase epsilon subunit
VSGPEAKREDPTRPPLLLVEGTATDEEVAALTAVLTALATARSEDTPPSPRSQWSSPGRAVHAPLRHGPGAWRASALPR